MKITPCTTGLLFAAAGAVMEKQPVQINTLLCSDSAWDGSLYMSYPAGLPELSVLKISLPPGAITPWHSHAMPTVSYVLSGEVTVEKRETEESTLISAGEALPEIMDGYHRWRTANIAAEVIVFYAGVKGIPLAIPEMG